MNSFALYDLDRTILRHASFTPFLLFAARQRRPWRIVFAPVWVLTMLAYKAGLFTRGALKQTGLRMFLGSNTTDAGLAALGEAFAEKVVPAWVAPGAAQAIAADRAAGRELVMVTAAMQFYAEPIARRLNFSQVIATGHVRRERPGFCALEGENCYGAQKVLRVAALLAERGLARKQCHLVFYSDSASDTPLFDYSDEGVLVGTGAGARRLAAARGWQLMSFASLTPAADAE